MSKLAQDNWKKEKKSVAQKTCFDNGLSIFFCYFVPLNFENKRKFITETNSQKFEQET